MLQQSSLRAVGRQTLRKIVPISAKHSVVQPCKHLLLLLARIVEEKEKLERAHIARLHVLGESELAVIFEGESLHPEIDVVRH